MKYAFDKFEFDCLKGELRRNNQLVSLEPQVCQLLTMLISKHGEFVSREKILEEIWVDRTVSPNVIDNRIRGARIALGDDGRRQRYIKTYPNRGFRFIGEIRNLEDKTTFSSHMSHEGAVSKLSEKPSIFKRYRGAATAFFSCLMIGPSALYIDEVFSFSSSNQDTVTWKNKQPVVAVLPIIKSRSDTASELYGYHLAEVMINTLSKMSSLDVISSLSSFPAAEKSKSPRDASSTLGADYLVTSTVWHDGDDLNATVQFVRSDNGVVAWSKTFHKQLSNGGELAAETAIAREAVISISNYLGLPADFTLDKTVAQGVHTLLIKGNKLIDSGSSSDILEAISTFRQIITKEPSYVPGYLKLAYAYHRAIKYAGFPTTTAAKEIKQFSLTATTLAPKSAEAFIMQGLAAQNGAHLDQALQLYDNALAIQPNHRIAILLRAEVLETLGRVIEAGESLQYALTFDPLSSEVLSQLARIRFGSRNVDEALGLAKQNLRWNRNRIEALVDLGQFKRETGDYIESYQLLTNALEINPSSFDAQFQFLLLMKSLGKIEEALPYLTTTTIKALAFAFADNKIEAHRLSETDPGGAVSPHVEYIYGDSKPLYNYYIKSGLYNRYNDQNNTISMEHIFDLVFKAHVYQENGNEENKLFMGSLKNYFTKIPLSDFKTEEEFIAATAFKVLERNFDVALEIIDEQIKRGFLSVGSLERSPVFKELRNKPGFKQRITNMKKLAYAKWNGIYSTMAKN